MVGGYPIRSRWIFRAVHQRSRYVQNLICHVLMSLWILMHLYTFSLRYRLFSCSSQHERLGVSHQPLQHWLCIHHQPGYHSCDCRSLPCLGFRWPCYRRRSCYSWLCMCWNPLVLNQTNTDFILVVCLSPY